MTVPYGKGWLSVDDQIELLALRGLLIDDEAGAREFFSHVNYHRFDNYCRAFESSRHVFFPGTSFTEVVALYDFDGSLRELLSRAIRVFEIDLRTILASAWGEHHGAFGHRIGANFFRTFAHADWLAELQGETIRSREFFIKHYRETYDEFPDLPIWMAVEIMPMRWLSAMFAGMKAKDQKPLIERYEVSPVLFASWLHHLTYVYNLTTHHARIWDRLWSVSPKLPRSFDWMPPSLPAQNRLFATLLILSHLLAHCPRQRAFTSLWRASIESHIDTMPPITDGPARMGLPGDWKNHPDWIAP